MQALRSHHGAPRVPLLHGLCIRSPGPRRYRVWLWAYVFPPKFVEVITTSCMCVCGSEAACSASIAREHNARPLARRDTPQESCVSEIKPEMHRFIDGTIALSPRCDLSSL